MRIKFEMVGELVLSLCSSNKAYVSGPCVSMPMLTTARPVLI